MTQPSKSHSRAAGNLGATGIRRRARKKCAMREYDRLPAELRHWLSTAALPWRPGSVQRAFDKAFDRTKDKDRALQELDRLQARLIAKDAGLVWGRDHPQAVPRSVP